MQKLQAVRLHLYGKGAWNDFQPYQYDFDDPNGQSLSGKVLANYLANKKGNCVSMPILMLLLSDRLGLDVSLSTAPLHVLLKFTDTETGKTYYVEATSGGGFSRDQWYQEKMHVTDQAIRSGIYLQKLTRRQTATVIVDLLGEHYFRNRLYDKALDHFKQSLALYPMNVHAMLKIGACYSNLFKEQFASRYRKIEDVPPHDRPRLNFYVDQNKKYFQMAESLGWREEATAATADDSRAVNRAQQRANRCGT